MKLQLNKSNISLRLVLLFSFLGVVAFSCYLAYSYLYASVFMNNEPLPEAQVVRVNLKAYESTIEYLEGLADYTPETLVLPRNNPFQ